ncbi:hypothetical protein [Stenotrophomonas sp.]|uniref:hypothetical protein n=1 Tax=Stenotrophomonas sp. TaxID=69392 RepID=UPI0031D57E11
MPLNPVDTATDHGSYKGDPAKVAFEKLNDNDAYLDNRVTTALESAAAADEKATSAQDAANAAAPKASPFFTGVISSAQTPLESGAGSVRTIFDMSAPNGDDDKLQLLAVRVTAGSGWTGVIWRLRRLVNGFQQGILEFGQPSANTGVTIDGGRPWTSANTTVDGNNFIKRA